MSNSPYKVISYYFNDDVYPQPLIDLLESNKLSYLIFPAITSLEEIENILKRTHNDKFSIYFVEPDKSSSLEENFEWLKKSHNVLHLFEDENDNINSFYFPVEDILSDRTLNCLANIIFSTSLRQEQDSKGEELNDQNGTICKKLK